MNIKPGFELRDICGEKVVIAIGLENMDFSRMVSLNETAAFLWEKAQGASFTEADLVDALRGEYDVDEATAEKDVHKLVETWKEIGLVDD